MKSAVTHGVCLLFILAITHTADATAIWDGPDVTITNPPSAGVQDMLTSNVTLTRGETAGLYNAAQEASFDTINKTSPADTKWAFLGLNGNSSNSADITAANFANLNFNDWADSLGGTVNLQGNIVNRPGVVHLVSDDIYLNIQFTAWGGGISGGSFSYTRSTAPTPAAPGDTDSDGDIDDSDLGTSFANYTGPVGNAGKTAADGDTDGDGDVDDSDLGSSFANYTGPLSPTSVPEPASLTLLGALGSAILLRRHGLRA